MKICVFCGSNPRIGEPYVSAVRELGAAIGATGNSLVFGGYDVGLMGVISHSVHDAGGLVHGVTSKDVAAADDRPVFPCDELECACNITERKFLMKRAADAFIAAPGSFGTYDEIFEVCSDQKIAVMSGKPVAFHNIDGFYDPLIQLFDKMHADGFMSDAERGHIFISDDPEAILAHIVDRS